MCLAIAFVFVVIQVSSKTLAVSPHSVKQIKKCCPQNQLLVRPEISGVISVPQVSHDYYSCQNRNDFFHPENGWNLSVFKFPNDVSPLYSTSFTDTLIFPQNQDFIPQCAELKALENGEEIWFRFLEDGKVVVGLHFWFWPAWLPVNDTCVDQVGTSKTALNGTQVMLFCNLEGYEDYLLNRAIYGTCFMISATFMLFTLGIFVVAKHGLGPNIHFWLQFSYFLALFLFFVVEGTRIFTKFDGLYIKPSPFCFYHAVISQYFAITMSTTVVFLGFDMLWTFWKMRPTTSIQRPNLLEICAFIFIPWGIPFFGLVFGLAYNHYTNVNAQKQEIGIFEFGHFRCASPAWFTGIFIHTVIYVVNLLYFVLVTAVIIKTLHNAQFATKSSQRKFATDSFHILVKVSLTMGLYFGSSVYELYFGQNALNYMAWYWAFGRIFLFSLQGLWLFLAFGCSKTHRIFLSQKFSRQGVSVRGLSTIGGHTINQCEKHHESTNV